MFLENGPMVGGIMALGRCSSSDPGTYEFVTLHGRRGFADVN
jgi:hypothetical protein